MERTLLYENKNISYFVRNSKRAHRIRISVQQTGTVILTKPFFVRESEAENFLRTKADWISKTILRFSQLTDLGISGLTKNDFKKYKDSALALCEKKVKHHNLHYKLTYNTINIRNQESRWGSCSSKKNLNFNYKILFLPEDLQDYLIVHELCHLREMNHSRAFWAAIAETIPNYKELNRKLKQCLK